MVGRGIEVGQIFYFGTKYSEAMGATVVTPDGSEMLRWGLAGMAGRPPMDIRGDAAFAAEVAWLAENLRWDIEDDLARVIGDGPARLLGRLGGGLAQTVGAFVQRVRRPA